MNPFAPASAEPAIILISVPEVSQPEPEPEIVVEPEPEPTREVEPEPAVEPEPEPAANPFEPAPEHKPPRRVIEPEPETEAEFLKRTRNPFPFDALAPKPAAEQPDINMPDRAGGYGDFYEEREFGVNQSNPFLKQNKKKEQGPYNPFAKADKPPLPPLGAAAIAATSSSTSSPSAAGAAKAKKPAVNKNRPPPTRKGYLDKLSGGKHWCVYAFPSISSLTGTGRPNGTGGTLS